MCILGYNLYEGCHIARFDSELIFVRISYEACSESKPWVPTVIVERGQNALQRHAGKGIETCRYMASFTAIEPTIAITTLDESIAPMEDTSVQRPNSCALSTSA